MSIPIEVYEIKQREEGNKGKVKEDGNIYFYLTFLQLLGFKNSIWCAHVAYYKLFVGCLQS